MPAVPEPHASFLRTAVACHGRGPASGGAGRVAAPYLAGHGTSSAHPDLVVAVEPGSPGQAVLAGPADDRGPEAGSALAAFTGESARASRGCSSAFTGRLLLRGPQFVSLADVGARVE